ncbi:MAG: hypothetical protein NC210_00330 [[Clostridium] fimetarium]|nr:hypothetical protein [Alistipes timonensis]MCM1404850.1 hypothetical protein [[Clostridium] fimetarium]
MRTVDTLIWKVLKANISISQTVGYIAALFAGLAIIMTGAALYADMSKISGGTEGQALFPDSFRVVSKRADSSPFSLLSQGQGFTDGEIEEISSRGFVKRCAPFVPSRFDASVSADFGGARFSTAIFFEGVPDEFFDTLPDSWGFDPDNPDIPIVLPSDYLALYNFGYAPSRGLPKLSPKLLSRIPLRVMVQGRGKMESFPAHIAGFTDRLNTIVAPIDFIEWANDRFGEQADSAPLRLIVETKGDAEAEAEKYFASSGLELSDGGAGSGRAAEFIRGVSAIVGAVGIVLCLLALMIATLSLGLLISKNRESINWLRQLGFPASEISKGYRRMVIAANIGALLLATAAFAAIDIAWRSALEASGVVPAPIWLPLAIGTAFAAAATLVSWRYIGKKVDF